MKATTLFPIFALYSKRLNIYETHFDRYLQPFHFQLFKP